MAGYGANTAGDSKQPATAAAGRGTNTAATTTGWVGPNNKAGWTGPRVAPAEAPGGQQDGANSLYSRDGLGQPVAPPASGWESGANSLSGQRSFQVGNTTVPVRTDPTPVAPAASPFGTDLFNGYNPHQFTTPYAENTTPPGEGYGPGFGETYGKDHIGQYEGPTMLETFAQQQLAGNNPYYDRLQKEGMDRINQQMIARGHGNSGGAMASLGNYAGALGAAQFKDMGDLLAKGTSAQLGRQAQGQSVANSVQKQQQDRMQQQWNTLSDIAHLGAGNVGGFYSQGGQMSGDAAMAGINAGANASQLQGQGSNAFSNLGWEGIKSYLGMGGGK